MDPVLLREYEAKLGDWLTQGYRVLADDVDGELRLTVHYVSGEGAVGHEREQEYWPFAPEIVRLLDDNDIVISRALAGPHTWSGPHPEDR
jgi:hypothetical protein